jgi:hypothetical protein
VSPAPVWTRVRLPTQTVTIENPLARGTFRESADSRLGMAASQRTRRPKPADASNTRHPCRRRTRRLTLAPLLLKKKNVSYADPGHDPSHSRLPPPVTRTADQGTWYGGVDGRQCILSDLPVKLEIARHAALYKPEAGLPKLLEGRRAASPLAFHTRTSEIVWLHAD